MPNQLFSVSNYYFNPYALPVILAGIVVLLIGLFVFNQNKRAILNVSFFYKCFAINFWLFTISIVYSSRSPQIAIFWYRYFTFFGVINIMPTFILFAIVWAGKLRQKRFLVITNYIISFVFYGLAVGTDKLISPYDIRKYFWGFYPKYSFWAVPFLIFFLIQIAISFANLYSGYKSERVPIKRVQRKLIAAASLIGFTASVDFLPKLFNIPLYPFGYISLFIYISLIAYSIVRYRTFDIETVIHKTIAWFFTFSFIIAPIFFLYRWFFPFIKDSLVLQAGFWVMAFLLLTLYLRDIQPKIDHFFQRRKSNLEEISNRFTEDLVHLKGLNQLIQHIKDVIADTLYPQSIDISIYNEQDKKYKEDSFLLWLAKNNKIAYREFIDIDPRYASIKEKAEDYFNASDAIVVMPLALNDKLLGIINLARKANLKRYSAADFYFLTAIKNQSTIAISNSLLYKNIEEQVRVRTNELLEMQKQLIQAEKLATVGTLAGGVAHEINNPLTAILTNVQMFLDSGNAGNITVDRESLELIEEATKRCRTIVQKLMAYAKKPLKAQQTSRIDLLQVVKNVNSLLGFQLEQDNIKMIVRAKEDGYFVSGNHNELEQVVTNMILNAKDAIKKIGESGEINIALSKTDEWVKIEIKDEGAGIKKEIMSKIFDPFFTTKEVGKGLGLGLSICQSIIEKHNGLITVNSEVNKGSTFTIKLPNVNEKSEVDSEVQ